MAGIPFSYSMKDLLETTADDVFSTLLKQSTNGVTVRSCAAPALSTQFVKSTADKRAAAGVDGAFAEIIYPSNEDVQRRLRNKHGSDTLFGYTSNMRTDAFPAGYGERAAKALAREESSYQLKGVFPSAALSYSKLRARVEAREGDVAAIDTIFAVMWGLPVDSVKMLPQLHIMGSEATRVSALEDRAYHSLAAHPSVNGGYRVDTATLAPDALGPDVPLNWPRIRVALKTIAHIQVAGDLDLSAQFRRLNQMMEFRFRMDFARGAQPQYVRSANWESIVERIVLSTTADQRLLSTRESDTGYMVQSELADAGIAKMLIDDGILVSENIQAIAKTVSAASSAALMKTIDIMIAADQARVEMEALEEEELQEMEASHMSDIIEVPRYKVVRTSLYKGIGKEFATHSDIPDMVSHGKAKFTLNMEEFRESKIAMPVDIPGALHLAVYMTTIRPQIQQYAYELMIRLSAIEAKLSPQKELEDEETAPAREKAASRLRKQSLYDDASIRDLGKHLFGLEFNNVFEMLLRNMATQTDISDTHVKRDLWKYLCKRSRVTTKSDVPGDWRDLMEYLWTAPEGWTLYYWVRMTIGRLHHATCGGILAPVSAGSEADALTVVKAGIKDRIRKWTDIYTCKYRQIEGGIAASRQKIKELEQQLRSQISSTDTQLPSPRYIPPHMRKLVDLEQQYSADEILSRSRTFEAEEYMKMVSAQTKAKFFASIDVFTRDRKVIVGLSDTKMREMLVEFYQARWYSLEVRIKKAKSQGKVFKLGPHRFEEHPWGELEEELPETIPGMLEFMRDLNPHAWTLPPDHVYQQLEKAIAELWGDVHAEVSALKQYAQEVHEGIVEQQNERDLMLSARSVVKSTLGTQAIPLAVPGYRAPNQMPMRAITIETRDGIKKVEVQPSTSKDILVGALDSDDDDELGDYDGPVLTSFTDVSEVIPEVDDSGYASLRTIWHALNLPQCPDNMMKFGLACGASADLDKPHVNSEIGPLVYVNEIERVGAIWRHQVEDVRRRVTGKATMEMGSDM